MWLWRADKLANLSAQPGAPGGGPGDDKLAKPVSAFRSAGGSALAAEKSRRRGGWPAARESVQAFSNSKAGSYFAWIPNIVERIGRTLSAVWSRRRTLGWQSGARVLRGLFLRQWQDERYKGMLAGGERIPAPVSSAIKRIRSGVQSCRERLPSFAGASF